MYLMIENKGVAPIEAYTVMGASAARGKEEAIGQFGTGAKHAVALLMRRGMSPVICLGYRRLTFDTRPITLSDVAFDQVVMYLGDEVQPLGFVTAMGAIDWDDPDMAFREFVSNALDQCSDTSDVRVEVVPEIVTAPGVSRIFLPFTSEAAGFYQRLKQWFLRLDGTEVLESGTVPRRCRNFKHTQGANIYRKGVWVRELVCSDSAYNPALFDYNINDLQIDEVRKANDSAALEGIARVLADAPQHVVNRIVAALKSGEKCVEVSMTLYYLKNCIVRQGSGSKWHDAFILYFGTDACVCDPKTADTVTRKGFAPAVLPRSWQSLFIECGVRSDSTILTKLDTEGITLIPGASEVLDSEIRRLWSIITLHSMSNGRACPQGRVFVQVMDAGCYKLGYYSDNMIYVNQDQLGVTQSFTSLVLEEMVHHVTGAGDNSRDFQDYILRLLAKLVPSC